MPDKKPPVRIRIRPLGEYPKAEVLSAPATTAEESKPQLGAALPAGPIQPLGQELMERALEALEVRYTHAENGDPFSVFRNEALPGDMCAWLSREGEHKDIFTIGCTVTRKISEKHWTLAVAVANEHNAKCRFGRAFLDVTGTDATLCMDVQVPLRSGVTVEFLKEVIRSHLDSAMGFFTWSYRQGLYQGAQSTPPRKRLSAAGKQRKNGRKSHSNGGDA